MKKQDIAALIDGKIKGQGSAIDIGGALPEILGGLNDNSVSDDMTEDAQMQMRKDLGLYYDLTHTEDKVAEYTDQEFVNYWAKISDETPAKDDLIGVENLDGSVTPISDFEVADMAPDAENGYTVSISINAKFMIYFKEADGRTPGIYIANTAAETYKGLKWQEVIPDKQGVPEEFLPEIDEVEGNPEVPGGTSPTALQGLRINENYFSIPQGNVKKILSDLPIGDYDGQEATKAIGTLSVGDLIVETSGGYAWTVLSVESYYWELIRFATTPMMLQVCFATLRANADGTFSLPGSIELKFIEWS